MPKTAISLPIEAHALIKYLQKRLTSSWEKHATWYDVGMSRP